MRITIDFIPHLDQRYNTCGDWVFSENGDLSIKISDTGTAKWNECLALHELVEALACKANGVSTEEVDAFDLNWKPAKGFNEPGDDPRSPYFLEHQEAMTHEEQLFDFMSTDNDEESWREYELKLNQLEAEYNEKHQNENPA